MWLASFESCSTCRIIFLRSMLLDTHSLPLFHRTSSSNVTSASAFPSNTLSYALSQSSSFWPDMITSWYMCLSYVTTGMDFNVWDESIISSAHDWRNKTIIGETLALASDVQTQCPSTVISWSGLRTWWICWYLFSSMLPPPFFGLYSEHVGNASGFPFALPGR